MLCFTLLYPSIPSYTLATVAGLTPVRLTATPNTYPKQPLQTAIPNSYPKQLPQTATHFLALLKRVNPSGPFFSLWFPGL